jgi:CYTH domain-containing protein
MITMTGTTVPPIENEQLRLSRIQEKHAVLTFKAYTGKAFENGFSYLLQ